MSSTEVELDLLGEREGRVGSLIIRLLPGAQTLDQPLLDLRDDTDRDLSLAPVQLLEGAEYRYLFNLPQAGELSTDRPEIFEPDDTSGRSGRLRPGLNTGTVPIRVSVGHSIVAKTTLEVRSRKLDYLSQYRWMLRDLAESAAEIIMERFATSQQSFSSLANVDAKTLYQRFAFLQSLLEDEAFVAALHRIVHRPYIAWEDVAEERTPKQSIRGGSQIARSLTRPGPRLKRHEISPRLHASAWSDILPRKISIPRTEETLDNFPNRFAKFALTRWRDQAAAVFEALTNESDSTPVFRGLAEAGRIVSMLDELLTARVFREAGHLQHFSADNPVLLKREGYRDVYRAFLQFELAAQLNWAGGEDVYGGGQRNVATLYEFWAFLQLALVLSRLCGNRFDFRQLFELQQNRLGLQLKRGRSIVLRGALLRFDRRILVELWFNRTFSTGTASDKSWSRTMRPDCSLRLRMDRSPGDRIDDVWVHFDAKYRVDRLVEIFGGEEPANSQLDSAGGSSAKRDDLLKMHAYRDAIHRSAGAYVLYPGESEEQCKKYHELLPGLGAFGLRPSADGQPLGAAPLTTFLNDVITHVASQITQHERSRFWERQSFAGSRPNPGAPAVAFLDQPPADTPVLLGYVKNAEHRDWIARTGLYNLRADRRKGSVNLTSSQLAAKLVLLYSGDDVAYYRVVDEPVLKTADELIRLGYPNPKGSLYLCLPVKGIETLAVPKTVSAELIHRLVQRAQPTPAVIGMPVVVSWLQLVEGTL